MTIEIIKGCLLDAFDRGDVNVIGHCVNCQGVMGSGIALSIKERYPEVFKDYREFHDKYGADRVFGSGQSVGMYNDNIKRIQQVFNLHGQDNYGRSTRHLNYGAIGDALGNMADKLGEIHQIGFPYKMGCDRAGGDWEIVLEMIEFYFKSHNVKIYKLE